MAQRKQKPEPEMNETIQQATQHTNLTAQTGVVGLAGCNQSNYQPNYQTFLNKLRIWDSLGKTDPSHTKDFTRSGGFKGTATKPIYMTQRMTELFGPCGIGWGMDEPKFMLVPAIDELMVYSTVKLWYKDANALGVVHGVGGDKVVTKTSNGLKTNDEAYKASYTDALSNAMKQIGMCADIHLGQFADSKYVSSLREEFAEAHKPEPPKKTEPAVKTPVPATETSAIKPLVVPPVNHTPAEPTNDPRPSQASSERTLEPYPSDGERAAYNERLKKVIAKSNRDAVIEYVLAECKVTKSADITKPKWDAVLGKLEAVMGNEMALKELVVGK